MCFKYYAIIPDIKLKCSILYWFIMGYSLFHLILHVNAAYNLCQQSWKYQQCVDKDIIFCPCEWIIHAFLVKSLKNTLWLAGGCHGSHRRGWTEPATTEAVCWFHNIAIWVSSIPRNSAENWEQCVDTWRFLLLAISNCSTFTKVENIRLWLCNKRFLGMANEIKQNWWTVLVLELLRSLRKTNDL